MTQSIEIQDIHNKAVSILLDRERKKEEVTLNGINYSYLVCGSNNGYLYYKKNTQKNWILVANWCFYGFYIIVRYRKPLWLRPMYEILFKAMNFVHITFLENSIELLTTDGTFLRSRRHKFIPPGSLERVLSNQFGYSKEKSEGNLHRYVSKAPYSPHNLISHSMSLTIAFKTTAVYKIQLINRFRFNIFI